MLYERGQSCATGEHFVEDSLSMTGQYFHKYIGCGGRRIASNR
jgi:hypothetical protein